MTPAKSRGTRGNAALLAGREVVVYGLRFGRLTVLARLLTPDEFGIYGLASVLLAGLAATTAIGTRTYIVQLQELRPNTLRSVWLFDLTKGLVLTLVGWLVAPLYVGAGGADAVLAVRIATIALVLTALRSPGLLLQEREVDFRPGVIVEIAGTVAATVVAISTALIIPSAVALVVGLVAGVAVESAVSWIGWGMIPTGNFTWDELRAFWKTGRHLLTISIVTLMMTQGDYLVVGLTIGTAALGVYLLAYRLVEIGPAVMSNVLNRVVTARLSRLQADKTHQLAVAQTVVRAGHGGLLLISALLALTAPALIPVVYGSEFTDAIGITQLLAATIWGRGISQLVAPTLVATGRFRLVSTIKVIEAAAFVIAVLVGGHYAGVLGISAAVSIIYVGTGIARLKLLQATFHLDNSWLLRLTAQGVAVATGTIAVDRLRFNSIPHDGLLRAATITTLLLVLYAALDVIPRHSAVRAAFGNTKTSR